MLCIVSTVPHAAVCVAAALVWRARALANHYGSRSAAYGTLGPRNGWFSGTTALLGPQKYFYYVLEPTLTQAHSDHGHYRGNTKKINIIA